MSLPETIAVLDSAAAAGSYTKRAFGEFYLTGTNADQPHVLKFTSKLSSDGYTVLGLNLMRSKNISTGIQQHNNSGVVAVPLDPKLSIDLVVKARLGDSAYGFFTEQDVQNAICQMFSAILQPSGTGLAFTTATTLTRWLRGER